MEPFAEEATPNGFCLDEELNQKHKLQRERRFYRVTVPKLRVIGFLVLLCLVWGHESWLHVPGLSLPLTLRVPTLLIGGWVLLATCLARWPKSAEGLRSRGEALLHGDQILMGAVGFATGGPDSLLLYVPWLRVADVAYMGVSRALVSAHVALVTALVALGAWHLTMAPVEWSTALGRVTVAHSLALYLCSAASVPESLRKRTSQALRLTRQAVAEYRAGRIELLKSRAAAEEANRVKTDFLANISHEIRTPMNGIVSMCDLARDVNTDPEVEAHLEIVARAAAEMELVIGDVLDFSSHGHETACKEEQRVDLESLLQELIASRTSASDSCRGDLILEVDRSIPPVLMLDEGRLRQIVDKLLSNAVKFSEGGDVRVSCVLLRQLEGHATLQLVVQDWGIGIPIELQRRIFEPFVQADSSATRQFGGSGLGLSIASRLAETLGGRIEVCSEPGMGSTFTVTLPVLVPNECVEEVPAALPSSSPEVVPLRVLVAEDNPVNQLVARRLLEAWGHEVVVASDGAEALLRLEESSFDLILMDLQMPGMDGFTATERIRARADSKSETPIFALTANVQPHDRARCAELGMDGFLAKPIKRGELQQALSSARTARA